MPVKDTPEAVRRLILEAIDSVAELEAVLLLRTHPDRSWTSEEAGQRLYVSDFVAAHVLAQLAARGFLVAEDRRYRYRPASSDLDQAVTALASAYASDLIGVTRLIHAKPAASVLQFAEAFRVRKDS
jgi:hypothetical protein